MSQFSHKLQMLRVLHKAGIFKPVGLKKSIAIAKGARKWGPSPAFGFAAAAIKQPEQVVVIDDHGSTTFTEVHRRSNALARALNARGIKAGDSVGMMCRNHRGFIEAALACAKVGANTILLNTMFAGPQLVEVCKREGVTALLYDDEFELLVDGLGDVPCFLTSGQGANETIDQAIARHPLGDVEPPAIEGRFTVLTSGTTGTPKGAKRSAPKGLMPLASMLSRMPLGAGERTMIAAPLFHSWGLGHLQIGIALGSTYVLQRRFDPEGTLRAIHEHRCTSLAAVPIMLSRILALPSEVKRRYDLSSLRITAVSGSALPGDLATEWMDTFGDHLYNFYGSTEAAMVSVATPEDMRAAPGTAGKPPLATRVLILDAERRPVPQGERGSIFVGNAAPFDGYTSGEDKERFEGMVCTGDVGHFDEYGRLHVDGRDDDMIVSGGENVFPREVEDLLVTHEKIFEAAVIGVPDPEWGQRLKAFVVLDNGSSVSADELKEYIRTRLASYKVPRDIEFLEALPRNPTGKILKRQLQAARKAP